MFKVEEACHTEISVQSVTVWDEMSFGWPSDGNKPISFVMNSVFVEHKNQILQGKKRNVTELRKYCMNICS